MRDWCCMARLAVFCSEWSASTCFNVIFVPAAFGDVAEILGVFGKGHVDDDCCSPASGGNGMKGGMPGGLNPGTKVLDGFVCSVTSLGFCSPSAIFVACVSLVPVLNSCSELTSSEAFSEVSSTPSKLALG